MWSTWPNRLLPASSSRGASILFLGLLFLFTLLVEHRGCKRHGLRHISACTIFVKRHWLYYLNLETQNPMTNKIYNTDPACYNTILHDLEHLRTKTQLHNIENRDPTAYQEWCLVSNAIIHRFGGNA